jgi:hypothetical protein
MNSPEVIDNKGMKDEVRVGCVIRNSLGAGVALGADLFTYRLICENGAIAKGRDLGSIAIRFPDNQGYHQWSASHTGCGIKGGVELMTKKLLLCAVLISALAISVAVPSLGEGVQAQVNPKAIEAFQDMKDVEEIVRQSILYQTYGISSDSNLVVLSHRFDEGRRSSEIVGEIMNNGTRSYDRFDVDIIANFRHSAGGLVSSERGFIDADRLRGGDSSAFSVFVAGDGTADQASTYDLIINDDRVVVAQPLDEEFEADENEDEEEEDDN